MVKKTEVTIDSILKNKEYKATIEKLPFEDAMKLLEELVESVERGDLPLDQTVSSYERGALLIARMKGLLEGAEKKLEVLDLEGRKKS